MNGDSQKIYTAIQQIQTQVTQIQTKQEERHTENKQDLKIIFKKVEKLDNLPCGIHNERMKFIGMGMKVIYAVVLLIIGWIIAGKI